VLVVLGLAILLLTATILFLVLLPQLLEVGVVLVPQVKRMVVMAVLVGALVAMLVQAAQELQDKALLAVLIQEPHLLAVLVAVVRAQ
jgi:hypothetical protein